METRTQWELAAVTVALAISAGTYGLGVTSSNDTVKQLEKSLDSYEKLDKLNTEEFIDSVITTTSELKLSTIERKTLNSQKDIIKKLNLEIEGNKANIIELQQKIDNKKLELSTLLVSHKKMIDETSKKYNANLQKKDDEIALLKLELSHFQSDSFAFELAEGKGINLKKGKAQIGLSTIEYGNKCHVSVNNEHKEMKAGDFSSIEGCRITLTDCDYGYSLDDKVAKFEMVCFSDN